MATMDSDDEPFTDFNIADVEEFEIFEKLVITNNNMLLNQDQQLYIVNPLQELWFCNLLISLQMIT